MASAGAAQARSYVNQGLNLTYAVREGIYLHSKARRDIMATAWGVASTLEGQIIKITDSIAYINHDIDDAVREERLLKRHRRLQAVCLIDVRKLPMNGDAVAQCYPGC